MPKSKNFVAREVGFVTLMYRFYFFNILPSERANSRSFRYKAKNPCFRPKTWYMGKIPCFWLILNLLHSVKTFSLFFFRKKRILTKKTPFYDLKTPPGTLATLFPRRIGRPGLRAPPSRTSTDNLNP